MKDARSNPATARREIGPFHHVNLANHDVQQHIFGDIFKRSVVAELRLAL